MFVKKILSLGLSIVISGNILSADYTHIGIGIQDGEPYGKMFTQIFIEK